MVLMRISTLASLAALACAGCATRDRPTERLPSFLPAPTSTASSPGVDYRIAAFDTLQVTVLNVAELSGTVQVSGSGDIAVPLVGDLRAADKTPRELATALENAYRGRFIRSPDVTVLVTQAQGQKLTVEGEVGLPGIYPVIGHLTLIAAVAQAHGLEEYADPKNVLILRTIGQEHLAARYDVKAIGEGRMTDPEVYPGDTIIVDTAYSRRLIHELAPAFGGVAVVSAALLAHF